MPSMHSRPTNQPKPLSSVDESVRNACRKILADAKPSIFPSFFSSPQFSSLQCSSTNFQAFSPINSFGSPVTRMTICNRAFPFLLSSIIRLNHKLVFTAVELCQNGKNSEHREAKSGNQYHKLSAFGFPLMEKGTFGDFFL